MFFKPTSYSYHGHRKKLGFELSGGSTPPPLKVDSTPIFFYESKDNHKWGLHAKFQTSSSKTVDLHPHPNFLLFWPVNSVCGQTKGQIRFSIPEMDSLRSITYVWTPHTVRLKFFPKLSGGVSNCGSAPLPDPDPTQKLKFFFSKNILLILKHPTSNNYYSLFNAI